MADPSLTNLLRRFDAALSELAELRAELVALMPPAEVNGLDADDLADGNLLDTTSAAARFGFPQNTIRKWCRTEDLGVMRGGRWLVSVSAAAAAHQREINPPQPPPGMRDKTLAEDSNASPKIIAIATSLRQQKFHTAMAARGIPKGTARRSRGGWPKLGAGPFFRVALSRLRRRVCGRPMARSPPETMPCLPNPPLPFWAGLPAPRPLPPRAYAAGAEDWLAANGAPAQAQRIFKAAVGAGTTVD